MSTESVRESIESVRDNAEALRISGPRGTSAAAVLILALLASAPACDPAGEATPADGAADAVAGSDHPESPGSEAEDPEGISLLGEPLYRPRMSPEALARVVENLREAEDAFDAEPDVEENIIWLGRRLAYAGRYLDAIDVFSAGLGIFPDSVRLLRHRGHRHLSLRKLDAAVTDLALSAELVGETPDEIEPDGIPNRLNRPLSTTQFNIWYHLGLAHYLLGDYEAALEAYHACAAVSANPDLRVATAYWMYLTMRRLGGDAEAANVLDITDPDLELVENDVYLRLLLLFRGDLAVADILGTGDGSADPDAADPAFDDPALDDATLGYGIGAWYLVNGDPSAAIDVFRRVVTGESRFAFGFIAAEAELARGLLAR